MFETYYSYRHWGRTRFSSYAALLVVCIGFISSSPALAQFAVSDSGQPTFTQPIAAPPGVAGMSPKLAVQYAGIGVDGPLGNGWSLQGLSSITRCPSTLAVDNIRRAVANDANDKLCIDGQRLIQANSTGTPITFPQTNDALGLAGTTVREYRTQSDSFSRIRAYGIANSDADNGPAYFKIWTKSGQIFEYGATPSADANTKALVAAQGKNVVTAWAVARISDTIGNYIDFKYEQRDVSWGSGPVGAAVTIGREWNILEMQYGGNKIVFKYLDRSAASTPSDRWEAYFVNSKSVSIRLLQSITSYINSPNTTTLGPATTGAVAATTTKFSYDQGPETNRSRLTKLQSCAGDASSTRCLPSTVFTYTSGGNEVYTKSSNLGSLQTAKLYDAAGNYGVLTGDFNGDGKADFIRWSNTNSENQLWLNTGGSFNQATKFNITNASLGNSNGCYESIVADFNADGRSDILRIVKSCLGAIGTSTLYMAKGDDTFTAVALPVIDFTQKREFLTLKYNCLRPASQVWIPNCTEPGDKLLGFAQSDGSNYYVLDVNGDGYLDVVTTILPAYDSSTRQSDEQTCAAVTCTKVYRGSSTGALGEMSSVNVTHRSLYSDPELPSSPIRQASKVADFDGDGLSDVRADNGVWLSAGTGNFSVQSLLQFSAPCAYAIDFNGDGQRDCLVTSYSAASQQLAASTGLASMVATSTFNLKTAGQELRAYNSSGATTIDSVIADINGDGRGDILRWKDDPTRNTIYIGNGDGSFTASTTFNLNTANYPLQKSDGSYQFVIGDFTGNGGLDILRLRSGPTAGELTSNQLYLKAVVSQPDMMLSVTDGLGAKTTITYMSLTNAGTRYSSDRDESNAAVWPKLDVLAPMYVVKSISTSNGVGVDTLTTEFSYEGLKADVKGFGLLGFRQVARQLVAANGELVTTYTQYLQNHPYIGSISKTITRLGPLTDPNATRLATTVNSYCDSASAAIPAVITDPDVAPPPCATQAKIVRPYLYQTVEQAWELDGVALPETTTTTTVTDSGDPATITVTAIGTAVGVGQTFTKTTTNTYNDDVTTGDTWLVGRLKSASSSNKVPNLFGSIAASAGTNPFRTATKGTGTEPPAIPQPIDPGALSAIINLLLLDD